MNNRAQHTAGTVRVYRQIGLAKKARKRLPKPVGTLSIEREYAREILVIVALTKESLVPLTNEVPILLEQAALDRRVDWNDGQSGSYVGSTPSGACGGSALAVVRVDISVTRRIQELAEAARSVVRSLLNVTRLQAIVEKFAQRTSAHQRMQLARQVKAALGIDIATSDSTLVAMMETFVSANVSKIRSVPEELITGVEATIMNGVQKGILARDVAKELSDKFLFSQKRAKRIARDQIGTLTGQLTAHRHRQIGIEKFIWRAVGDERVRPLHRQINGNVYRYPKGHPTEGLPGVPVNCRCYPEPLFDQIMKAV